MKVVTIFASTILGNNPEESLKTKLTTIPVTPQENNVDFDLSIIFISEIDEDVADVKVFLKSPKDHISSVPYHVTVKGNKKDENVALGFYTKMPIGSEGQGIYRCIVDINGRIDRDELLFELKIQETANPTITPATN